MTLNVSFNAATEAKLREQSLATGKPVEHLIREAVEEKFGANGSRPATPQERTKRWGEWVRGMTELAATNLPAGYIADDSRQSVYAGRGE